MKHTSEHQSATSLPRAPRDEIDKRSARYLIMMGVRVLCFVLMVFVQPFGWYTWVFGLGAVFIPYIAVVLANVGADSKTVAAVPPERALPSGAGTTASGRAPRVLRIDEAHPLPSGSAPADGGPAASAPEHLPGPPTADGTDGGDIPPAAR